MGVEVVHHKYDDVDLRVDVVNENLDLVRPINGCPSVFRITVMISTERFDKRKDAACTVADVFRIYFPVASRLHGQHGSCLAKQLVWLLVHADHGSSRVVRELIHIKDVFHPGYEFRVFSAWDQELPTPTLCS